MSKTYNTEQVCELIATVSNFNRVLQQAGGAILTMGGLQDMSLYDFLVQVAAPNHISFKHTPPRYRIERIEDLADAQRGKDLPGYIYDDEAELFVERLTKVDEFRDDRCT